MKLYKYQAITEYSINALEKMQWWFSSPLSFNDPFEFKLIIPVASSIRKINNLDKVKRCFAFDTIKEDLAAIGKTDTIHEKWIEERIASLSKELSDEHIVKLAVGELQSYLYSLGVVSLTENNDNILMWSHYANFHKGVCFEFEIDEPSRDFFHKVIYSNDYPGIDFDHFPDITKIFNTHLITKSEDWHYEHEWRCIKTGHGLSPYFGRLISIIFGSRTPEADKTRIKAILKEKNINFFQARLHLCEYKLVIDPINT